MGKTKIDWPGLTDTWNIQTGCPRGCKYCVVRNRVWPRIKQFYGGHDYNEVVFHPEKLNEYDNKKNRVIFVCFYSDIEFCKREYLELIVDKCRQNKTNIYMFLTKFPKVYMGIDWPNNCILGCTITGYPDIPLKDNDQYAFNTNLYHLKPDKKNKTFLSFEPLSGYIPKFDFAMFEIIIVGAMTGSNPVIPKKEWIESIIKNIPKEKIYWKKNIHEYLIGYGMEENLIK